MKKFFPILAISIFFIFSCQQKMSCDNTEGIMMIKKDIMSKIIDAYALKLAAEDYSKEKYTWFISSMEEDYKSYLIDNLEKIQIEEGKYYELSSKHFIDAKVDIHDIRPQKYDEAIDKCECSAYVKVLMQDSKGSNKIRYSFQKNTQGELFWTYYYESNIMLDKKTNARDFIYEYNEIKNASKY